MVMSYLLCTGPLSMTSPFKHGNSQASSSLPGPVLRGPQCQVVTQELHDQSRVLVRVLGDIVKLSNRIRECGASHLACFLRITKHLVVEDREVQCQTQADRVRHGQLLGCLCHRIVVGHASTFSGSLLRVALAYDDAMTEATKELAV